MSVIVVYFQKPDTDDLLKEPDLTLGQVCLDHRSVSISLTECQETSLLSQSYSSSPAAFLSGFVA